ncbi:GntR family transcriptional regulator [Microbacterium sp.]|uniref:GntR family transcriptional regulator n=1 Tax=Microbacterium sp. TaxID=51671 RepID=UPI003A8A5C1B
MKLTFPAIDRASTAPLWFQIMRAIESQIVDATWVPGDRLPSESELCGYFDASRTSVREALSRLESAGIISRRQGKGAFVERAQGPSAWTLPSAPSLLGEYSEDGRSALTSQILRGGIEPLPSWAAAVIARGDSTGFVLERVRSVGSRVAVHVTNFMPARLAGILPDLRDPRASLYATITRVVGTRIARMHRTIEAATADRTLATLLEVEVGHPIVVVDAVAYDQTGEPIDISRASVRTDRMRVSVDTGFDAGGMSHESASGRYPTSSRPDAARSPSSPRPTR